MEDGASKLSRVAVVGAGWAGCAAAVTLARLGHAVTLYDAAPVAGGRARRVMREGLPLDNGQHLMLGAYVQARNLLAAVHGGDGEVALARSPLSLVGFSPRATTFALKAREWPGSLGLAAGVLGARGLTVSERCALIAWFRRLQARGFACDARATVADLVSEGPAEAARQLWNPLCLAALNTPAERASAQVFANVLRDAFTGASGSSDFLLPATDLSTLFPDAAARFVESHGGRIELGVRARVHVPQDKPVVVARSRSEAFDAVVVAVGPHQLDTTLGPHPAFEATRAAARSLAYEPIATVWLGYATHTAVPPIARLDDAPGQWIVDRPDIVRRATSDAPSLRQIVGVVISASGPHDSLSGDALAIMCDAQLRRLEPRWPRLAWWQTIVERRATYACTPARARAPTNRPHPRVVLAGDWLDDEYPATLEAAARSGVAAAFALESVA